jgi:ribosome-associated toxin RatA of RatAB toxin-antitoxin module
MQQNRRKFLMIISLIAMGASSAAFGSSLSERTKRKLNSGEILISTHKVAGSDTPEFAMVAVIDATLARVWHLVSHCNDFVRTMPRVERSKELSRKGDRIVCRVTVDLPFPFGDLTSTTEARHHVADGVMRRTWRLLSGDFKVNSGSWTLSPFAGNAKRTLVRYRTHVIPKIFLPGWVRRAAQKSSMPKLIKNLRRLLR